MVADSRAIVLDVGHGNSAVIRHGSVLVAVDAGGSGFFLDFLQDLGLPRVDHLLISHSDDDHLGGLIGVLSSAEVSLGRVYLNPDAEKRTARWEQVRQELDKATGRGQLERVTTGISTDEPDIELGEGAVLEILGPSVYLASGGVGSEDRQGRRVTANSLSIVVRLVINGVPRMLLTGDLDEVGLDELEAQNRDLRANVLVFPHHGGRSRKDSGAFARRLCEHVQPEVVVFSIGRGKHNTPRPEVVRTVRESIPTVRIMCTQLSKHCAATAPKRGVFGHLAGFPARGREKGQCCSGSIIVPFDSEKSVLPERDQHQDFIETAAPSALCFRRARDHDRAI